MKKLIVIGPTLAKKMLYIHSVVHFECANKALVEKQNRYRSQPQILLLKLSFFIVDSEFLSTRDLSSLASIHLISNG